MVEIETPEELKEPDMQEDMEIAKKLISNAKQANFDAVKFQKRDINLVYSKEIC